MFYGLFLQVLFLGLGLHYVLRADASARSKTIIGSLLAAVLLFESWMPAFLALSIQFLMCGYIVMFYRLQGFSFE
ncbi:MAG: hypothetical protein WD894_15020 [Pirellulales bacterium]